MKIRGIILTTVLLLLFSISAFAQSDAFLSSIQANLSKEFSLRSFDDSGTGNYYQTSEPPTTMEEETSGWRVDLTPYLWMAGMSGDATLRGIPIEHIDISFKDIIEDLDFGFAGHLEATKGKFTLFFDINYINISEKPQTVVVRVKNTVGELGATYHLGNVFEVLGGVRIIKWKLELTPSQIPVTFERSKTFVDPFVGGRVRFPLGKSFIVGARGDIGGFGVGSDFSWNIILDASIRVARWGSLYAGYRWWDDDYGENDNKDFQLDLLTNGPILGFTFHF
jgi:hypothetical protein